MSRKYNYKSLDPFHDRLFNLLKGDVAGWAKRLGVTESTIRDRWFKGSYPGADKIIRICTETNKSPNWLLIDDSTNNFYPYADKETHDRVDFILNHSQEYADDLKRRIQALFDRGKEIKELKEKIDLIVEILKIKGDIK